MKVPINCPICNQPMSNLFYGGPSDGSFLDKKCIHALNHSLFIVVRFENGEYETIQKIRLDYGKNKKKTICWFTDSSSVIYTESLGESFKSITLPYFEPNFSNLNKLIDKIKLYILFS